MSRPGSAETATPGRDPHVLWVSTSLATRGGVASFVRTMKETALWTQWRVRHVATHSDGTIVSRSFAYLRAWPSLIREFACRPALVHIHMSSYGSFFRKSLVIWFSAALRRPVVLQVHGGEFHLFHASAAPPLQWYIRVSVESAAVVVALGRTWQQRLQAIAPKARIVVVPNSVRLERPVAQPGQGEPVQVLFLGRVAEGKGTFDLLEAWHLAFGDRPEAVLTIAGDGELEQARGQIAELGIDRSVKVLGWVPPEDVPGLLERAQVLALPSHNEGQPMAVLEAMAHGLCVVASDTGGIPDLIDDGCGVLVPVGDVAALAAALRRVVSDDKARRSLGGKALQRIRDEFDVAVVSRRFDDLYRSVLR